ncbi:geranylgeranyltransferase [Plasmodium falciparum RAJ116]|nr:geranylgeranyltransferase [Plasmodium falciparum RAJ116]
MSEDIEFVQEKHIQYLESYTTIKNAEELIFNETLKMCGVFYFLCSCKILSHTIEKKEEFINFILKCQNVDGGFGNNINYDSHIVSTHHAILSLLLLNYSFDKINEYMDKANNHHDINNTNDNNKVDLNNTNNNNKLDFNNTNDNNYNVYSKSIRENTC